MKRLSLCLSTLLLAATVHAQVPAPPAGANVELDPIRCWWRTDAGAVRVGEIFELSLTCAALDNDAVKVIVDESRLGPQAITLSPFEVVDGSHPSDLRSGGRRFFQYHYQVRIISPDVIGQDAPIPSIPIHYAINNTVAGNTAIQGRDLVYLLPTEAIRIASMVPASAADIRDAAGEDFTNAERLLFRASVLDLAATTAAVLGVLVLALVLVGLARKSRTRVPAGERRLPIRSLIGAASRELGAVAREREAQGWTPALASRALAATRVAAAAALEKAISQRLVGRDAVAADGQLLVGAGLRGKPRVISGSTTALDLDRTIRTAAGADAARAPMLESLRDAINQFGASQYGREAALDQSALDEALGAARSAVSQVQSDHSWLKTVLRQWRSESATPVAAGA